jgi:hypothetical protein
VSPDAVDRNAGFAADQPAGQRQDGRVGVTGQQQVRRVMPAERAEHGGHHVEAGQQREDDQRRAAGVRAVRVGVEADQNVRQTHRAEADRQDQRQAGVERVRFAGTERLEPGRVALRGQAGADRDGVAGLQRHAGARTEPVRAVGQPDRSAHSAAVHRPVDRQRLGHRRPDRCRRADRDHGVLCRARIAARQRLVPVLPDADQHERRHQQRDELQPELQGLRERDRPHAAHHDSSQHDAAHDQSARPARRAGLRAECERRALQLRDEVEPADEDDQRAGDAPDDRRAEPDLREVGQGVRPAAP